nr:uncharacterized protein LOC112039899 [Quercus suber]
MQPSLIEKIIAVCWGIWKDRNEKRMGGSGKPGRVILKNALNLVDEYSSANFKSQEVRPGVGPMTIWHPPDPEQYKVNVDGAVFEHRKKAGIGVVIRDECGEVVAALSKVVNAPLGAVEIEAKAMEAGVLFARDVGIQEAVFEGDSLIICKALQGDGRAPSSIQNVLEGTLDLVSSFRSSTFSHVKRQGNVPAHLLAQYAKEVENYVVWLEECPSFLEHMCAHDISVVSRSCF